MLKFEIVIVGAGHGGAQAAISLRQQGYEGSIALVGDEPDPPYERPPLSKEYLAGEKTFERLLIRPQAFWSDRKVELMLGRRVTAVDAVAHVTTLEDGCRLSYGKLIWAAGGTARCLPCAGHDLLRVHAVRSRADVDRIIAELPDVERVVVIGGGFIGLEAAAVLNKLGKHVTLLEALDRVLARVAGSAISRFYEQEHRKRGVILRTGVVIDSIVGEGTATGVRLVDGEVVPADMVIVGVGIVPSIAPLEAAGAVIGNGVEIDEFCRTSLQDVYAIGDCAAHRNAFAGDARIRIESVQNATDQATTAAKHIAGEPEPYAALPWFWSNQYDLKLQTVGLSLGHDEALVRGDPARRRFSVVYLRNGKIVALDCVNSVKDYVQGRKLILSKASPDKGRIADPDVPLKDL